MVKGIRANRGKETEYINQCMGEIQKEVASKNMSTKSMAILKMAYLNMLGYDMSFSSFGVVEVMSTNRFAIKRPGYLAASLSFNEKTDVGLLTINLFKKDFGSKSQYEAGMAISCLSCITNPEISRDIITDLLSLLASSRAYLRKKTVLCLYKIFLKDPPALRTCFPKLKDRLTDEDQGVLTATVNTFLELARKNARNYLSLVPQFYHILVNTSNNWLSIKLLKVFQILTPLEPRLIPKLVEPLTNILNTTKAQSVEFEAIRCVVRAMPEGTSLAALALEKLQAFLNSSDRNLRFLALDLLREVLGRPEFKDQLALPDLHDKVLTSIEESDDTARRIALQLLDASVSPSNFQEAVQRLLDFSRKASANDEFVGTILSMGARDRYALVEDFAWYLLILGEIGRSTDSAHAETVAVQFVDICMRVPQVRPYAITLALGLLDATAPRASSELSNAPAESPLAMPMVGACAWLLGEYHADVEKPAEANFMSAAKILLNAKTVQALDPCVQTQCIWAATKLYLSSPQHAAGAVTELHSLLNSSLPAFVRSTHVDVSERASLALHIATFYKADASRVGSGSALFADAMMPVKADAQAQMPVPEDLALEEPFFAQEVKQENTFMPVRSDPADPYALATTYKDDLNLMASKEPPPAAEQQQRQSQQSSIYHLGQQAKDGTGAPGAEASQAAAAEVKDPLVLMREKLEAQRTGASGAVKYQVMRDDLTAPSTQPASGAAGQVASSSSTPALPVPPEKELTELQGRLWSVCYRGEHIAVYACMRSPNRKQLLRVDLRCERVNPGAPVRISDVALRFPDGVSAQEVDASGCVSLCPGELQQRSAKVKANLASAPFVSAEAFSLACELRYLLAQTGEGEEAQPASPQSAELELRLPATTFLVPRVMTEDSIAEYIAANSAEMLSHQTAQALTLTATTSTAIDLTALVGRCAGLCRFHGIQQPASAQTKGQKFILVAGPPASTGATVLEGQKPMPANANIVCMCAGIVRDTSVELRVTVKACRKEIADDVCSQLANTFRELVEGRLKE
eukprot:CAMPEP_0197631922 /NCGR_PEP_ID=MMETSP1338-20131121/8918_1 /TAXON_ID=43686 ORGANISM="Pelagodinium beii, Strain RCC1491" /NCGR_SAMPLE_ID=MMETSP1338 /ASSEMBLY_ACC=CAM_ASM_000754 /LENGTH=1034 /DNA_ID=CAMNT_0043203463 /DNA_START=17 /DNA_END=3121 /DNA_ORIENTATION=-